MNGPEAQAAQTAPCCRAAAILVAHPPRLRPLRRRPEPLHRPRRPCSHLQHRVGGARGRHAAGHRHWRHRGACQRARWAQAACHEPWRRAGAIQGTPVGEGSGGPPPPPAALPLPPAAWPRRIASALAGPLGLQQGLQLVSCLPPGSLCLGPNSCLVSRPPAASFEWCPAASLSTTPPTLPCRIAPLHLSSRPCRPLSTSPWDCWRPCPVPAPCAASCPTCTCRCWAAAEAGWRKARHGGGRARAAPRRSRYR